MSTRTSTRDREQFIADMASEEVTIDDARAILRVVSTLNRLAVAQCNGDWPADNGDADRQVPCVECMAGWHKSAIRKDGRCVDCHASDRAKKLVPKGWAYELQGDPRGCILTLVTPQGRRIDVP